jgi:hypothetical protein
MTRGEFASALVAAFARTGMALSADVPDAFTDDDNSEHRLALDQLAAAGVLLGTAQGTADAERLLMREQAATLLIRSHAAIKGSSHPTAQNPILRRKPTPKSGPGAILPSHRHGVNPRPESEHKTLPL